MDLSAVLDTARDGGTIICKRSTLGVRMRRTVAVSVCGALLVSAASTLIMSPALAMNEDLSVYAQWRKTGTTVTVLLGSSDPWKVAECFSASHEGGVCQVVVSDGRAHPLVSDGGVMSATFTLPAELEPGALRFQAQVVGRTGSAKLLGTQTVNVPAAPRNRARVIPAQIKKVCGKIPGSCRMESFPAVLTVKGKDRENQIIAYRVNGEWQTPSGRYGYGPNYISLAKVKPGRLKVQTRTTRDGFAGPASATKTMRITRKQLTPR